jgi:hypothetical protein
MNRASFINPTATRTKAGVAAWSAMTALWMESYV